MWMDLASTPQPLVWKATRPGAYGLVAGQGRASTPLDYLDRLWIAEHVLGFPWELEGVWLDEYGRPRFVTTQIFMPGRPATEAEIHHYLTHLDFHLLDDPALGPLWINSTLGVVISDAYPDNFVMVDETELFPVDLALAPQISWRRG